MTASPPTSISPAIRRSILLLSIATFTSMAGQRLCDAMLPELTRVFAVSLGDAARVVSFFAITYGITQMIYGPLSERVGKYRVITYAAMLCGLGSLFAALSTSLDMLVVARVVMSLGAAALISLPMAWIGDSVPADRVQEMLTRTGLGVTLGIVGGQLMGGLLTDYVGWRWAFAFMTVLCAAVSAMLYVDLRRQLACPSVASRPGVGPRVGFVKQALEILTGSWSRAVLVMAVIEGAAGFGVLAMWASHLHSKLGMSLSVSGAIVALFGLGGVFYMIVARPLIFRLGQQGLVIAGSCMLALCAIIIAFTPHWLPTIPASFIAGFGFFMFHNTMQATATMMTPQARGTAMSLFSSSLFLGQSLGVMLAAALISRMGSSAVIALGGLVMTLVGGYFAWALKNRAKTKETGARQP